MCDERIQCDGCKGYSDSINQVCDICYTNSTKFDIVERDLKSLIEDMKAIADLPEADTIIRTAAILALNNVGVPYEATKTIEELAQQAAKTGKQEDLQTYLEARRNEI